MHHGSKVWKDIVRGLCEQVLFSLFFETKAWLPDQNEWSVEATCEGPVDAVGNVSCDFTAKSVS